MCILNTVKDMPSKLREVIKEEAGKRSGIWGGGGLWEILLSPFCIAVIPVLYVALYCFCNKYVPT